MISTKTNENYFSVKKWCTKNILNKNNIDCEVVPSNVDEDQIKEALLSEKAYPRIDFEESCGSEV